MSESLPPYEGRNKGSRRAWTRQQNEYLVRWASRFGCAAVGRELGRSTAAADRQLYKLRQTQPDFVKQHWSEPQRPASMPAAEFRRRRGVLGWSCKKIGQHCGRSEKTVRRYESNADGEGISVPAEVADWIRALSDFILSNPAPKLGARRPGTSARALGRRDADPARPSGKAVRLVDPAGPTLHGDV